jgi:hypothetical protein
MVNEPGADWKRELSKQIRKTTHFIVLLTEGYEQSRFCMYELEEILKRGDVTILPLMLGGRSVPHPKLADSHHILLDGADPKADAEVVVQKVMEQLTGG